MWSEKSSLYKYEDGVMPFISISLVHLDLKELSFFGIALIRNSLNSKVLFCLHWTKLDKFVILC